MNEMSASMERLRSEKQEAEDTIDRLQQEVLDKQFEIDQKSEDNEPTLQILWETLRQYWAIIAPVLLALLLLCFLISKKMVESRIKARFHGIKIW